MRKLLILLSAAACLTLAETPMPAQATQNHVLTNPVAEPTAKPKPKPKPKWQCATCTGLLVTQMKDDGTGTTGNGPVKRNKHSYKGTVTLVK